ncbi:MAG: transglutaminase domain-containing protein [Burkholderiales bacterium]|nr:transglutaminase domain-containing protein [Burkholderiales bacterium]
MNIPSAVAHVVSRIAHQKLLTILSVSVALITAAMPEGRAWAAASSVVKLDKSTPTPVRKDKQTRFRIPEAKVREPAGSAAEYQERRTKAAVMLLKSASVAKAAPPAAGPADLAESDEVVLSPAVRALAATLNNNPVKISAWVHDNIRFAPTYGATQNSDTVLKSRQGNAFDIASLTIALLRAANIPARYAYGNIEVSANPAQAWLGGVATPQAALDLLAQGGVPSAAVIAGGRVDAIRLEHVWVEAHVDFYPSRGAVNRAADSWVPIDPSFKQPVVVSGLDLRAVANVDAVALSGQLLQGATPAQDGVTRLNQAALTDSLTAFKTQAQTAINGQKPNATVGDVLGRESITPHTLSLLAGTLPYKLVAQLDRYAVVPDAMRWRLGYGVYASDVERGQGAAIAVVERSLAALAGNSVAVTFAAASTMDQSELDQALASALPVSLPAHRIRVKAQLWSGGQLAGEGGNVLMGTSLVGGLRLFDPRTGNWIEEPSHRIAAGETHALAVAAQSVTREDLEASRDRLTALRAKLDARQFTGLTQAGVTAEMLHHTALTWLAAHAGDSRLVRRAQSMAGFALPSVARASTVADVTLQSGAIHTVQFPALALTSEIVAATAVPRHGQAARVTEHLRATSARGSVVAQLVMERIFATQAGATASAVCALNRANDEAQKLFVVTQANRAQTLPQLSVPDVTRAALDDGAAIGLTGLTGQRSVQIGGWTGAGTIIEDTTTGGGDYAVSEDKSAVHAPLGGWMSLALAAEAVKGGGATTVATTLSAALGAAIDYHPAAIALLADYDAAPWSSFVGANPVLEALWSAQMQSGLGTPLANATGPAAPGVMSLAHSISVCLASALTPAPTPNNAPGFTSTPPMAAVIGQPYQYLATAVDPDGDRLTFSLVSGPPGLTVSALGLVSWSAPLQGAHEVVVRVSDGKANTDQRYILTVGTVLPLELQLAVSPQFVGTGDTVTILVAATGGRSLVTRSLKINGVSRTLDANGQAIITAGASGVYRIEATASDGTDNLVREGFFAVRDPADTAVPVAQITTPEQDGEVSAPVNIIGTASDAALAEYQLLIAPAGSGRYSVFARGYTSVTNGVLGKLDPSVLANGLWDLLLNVVDVNGQVTTSKLTIEITGQLKVGQFSVSFLDMSVEAAGLPLQVTRTYDTRRKAESLDFGHGWTVDYQNLKLQKNMTTGLGWNVVTRQFQLCLVPAGKRKVNITLPDGKVERFEARQAQECATGAVPPIDIRFDPLPNTTSKLEVLNVPPLRAQGGQLIDDNEFGPWNPKEFKLTTLDGLQFFLGQDFGIRKVVEPNGNTLTFGASGVVHSNGDSITFTRDAQGRITAITDPTGKRVTYAYTADGDLKSATDRQGLVAEHTYDRRHSLLSFTDPRGVQLARNEYDEAGRLVAQYDANGAKLDLSARDPAANKEVVKDRRGGITTYVYDAKGNVTSQVDALNGTTAYTYDANDNELTVRDANGLTTTRTFDANNNQLTEANALGHTTTYAYAPNTRNVTKITDARGKVTDISYAGNGNLLSLKDGAGNVTSLGYDAAGNLTSLKNHLNQETKYVYDAKGRKIEETDPAGTKTTYTHDSNGNVLTTTTTRVVNGTTQTLTTTRQVDADGNVTQETDPAGGITRTTYNALKKPATVTDALGRVTQYGYDARGHLTSTTHPDGKVERKTYDADGNLTEETDRDGRTTVHTYDLLKRLTKTTYPDGRFIENTYDAGGRLTQVKDERGNTTVHEYDNANRRIKTTDPAGVTQFAYDNTGNLTQVTDPKGRITTHTYDDANRRTRTTHPITAPDTTARFEQFEYDGAGRRTAWIDTANIRTDYAYDPAGRLNKVTQPVPGTSGTRPVTQYGYDEQGNKVSQTDALNRQTKWEYDALGRMTKRILPGGQSESFEHDANGNVTKHTTFKGEVITYAYDELNRVKTKTVPAGTSQTGQVLTTETNWTYTASGQVEKVSDRRGDTLYQYDARDRVSQITHPEGWVVQYGYDEAGNRTSLKTKYREEAERTTAYEYDSANRLVKHTDPDGGITTFVYDANGNQTEVTKPNGTRTVNTFDERNRLTKIEHRRTSDNSLLQSFTTKWNAQGLRSEVTAAGTFGCFTQYQYDNLGRLTNHLTYAGTRCPQLVDQYNFDAVGNRTTDYNGLAGNGTYTTDANDRITKVTGSSYAATYEHDANGNVTKRIDNYIGRENAEYRYDAESRLIAVIPGSGSNTGRVYNYHYDHEGQLVGTSDGEGTDLTKTIRYLVDKLAPYSQVLEERDATGKLKARYDFVPGSTTPLKATARVTSGSTETLQTAYYHSDHLSVRLLTDTVGAVINTYAYSPFGEPIPQSTSGTFPNPHQFAGERYYAESGLTYLRARWLDQRTGRFVGIDPHPGTPTKPVTLHDYMYAGADAINGMDPSGNMTLMNVIGAAGHISNIYSAGTIIFMAATGNVGGAGALLIEEVVYSKLGGAFGKRVAEIGKNQLRIFYGLFKGNSIKLTLGAAPNSTVLRNNLTAVGVHAPSGSQAHHIVGGATDVGKATQERLKKLGVDLNSPMNGVFLPGCGKSNALGTIHCGKHTGDYERYVERLLSKATTKEQAINILNDIRSDLLNNAVMLNARS